MRNAILLAVLLSGHPSYASHLLQTLGQDEVEALLLKKFPQVTRSGEVLRIKTSSATVTFKDNPAAGEGTVVYRLVDAYPLQEERTDFLVIANGYEGGDFTLVNGWNGKTARIAAMPVLNENHSHYLVASVDLGAFLSPNLIDILDSDSFKREFHMDFEVANGNYSGPEAAVWSTAGEVFFVKKTVVGRTLTVLAREPTIVSKVNGAWTARPLK